MDYTALAEASPAGEVSGAASLEHHALPVVTSRAFREMVLDCYPALANHKNALTYQRMAEYVLFSTFADESTGNLVLPYGTVAQLAGVHPKSHGFSAQAWIENFSRDVFALNPSHHRYVDGHARTVDPRIDPEIQRALRAGRASSCHSEPVWFVGAEPVTRRSRNEVKRQHEDRLIQRSQAVSPAHPGYGLVRYTLEQSQRTCQQVFARNLPALHEALDKMGSEERKRDWAARQLTRLEDFNRVYYADVPNSPRLFSIGSSVLQLPRELRQIAFGGAVEMDLRACQLAVVARLWNIPVLQDFLMSGESIWIELLRFLGLPFTFKPIVKRTVYSLIFGMSRKNLRCQLAKGDASNRGIGEASASRFFKHSLILALLEARGRELDRIDSENGSCDAFGRWLPTMLDGSNIGKASSCRSVLSAQVQSYELKLLLPVLTVLVREPQIKLLGWLHDGFTLYFGNRTKADVQQRRIQKVVKQEAARLGMATDLEMKYLT